jgi:hypothetical protein
VRSFTEPPPDNGIRHAHETKETEGGAQRGTKNKPINENQAAVISAETENGSRTV